MKQDSDKRVSIIERHEVSNCKSYWVSMRDTRTPCLILKQPCLGDFYFRVETTLRIRGSVTCLNSHCELGIGGISTSITHILFPTVGFP